MIIAIALLSVVSGSWFWILIENWYFKTASELGHVVIRGDRRYRIVAVDDDAPCRCAYCQRCES
jgi:hypothetical protein